MKHGMTVKETAELTGVTVRTLHYYDKIGLLPPSEVTEAGYRLYDADALARLQQILFFRELEFPLEQIKEIISHPTFEAKNALLHHKTLLIKKRERLERLIELVENTIKGEKEMEFSAFDKTEIEKTREAYRNEVRERWGDTPAYKESAQKTAAYKDEEWQEITRENEEIFKAFAAIREQSPDSSQAQDLVLRWKAQITARFYTCTDEILGGLGTMYMQDERFRSSLDRFGEGTAAFMSRAITAFCARCDE